MLEDCGSLIACEEILSAAIGEATLVSDLDLSEKDFAILAGYIRDAISGDVSDGTRTLERQTPTCLAAFLVWAGIQGYAEGDYWSAVEAAVGPLDANWQARWGRIFVEFLNENNLPTFELPGALTYVTPILAHGGIPNSCLDEFFERVLKPLVFRDLLDPSDRAEIAYLLTVSREDAYERAEIDSQHDRLRGILKEVDRERRLVSEAAEAYQEVLDLWTQESTSNALQLVRDLPEEPEAFLLGRKGRLADLDHSILALEQRRSEAEFAVEAFSDEKRALLADAGQIEHTASLMEDFEQKKQRSAEVESSAAGLLTQLGESWKEISSVPYEFEFGDRIIVLQMDRLLSELGALELAVQSRSEERAALREAAEARKTPTFSGLAIQTGIGLLGMAALLIGLMSPQSTGLILVGMGALAAFAFRLWVLARSVNHAKREARETEDRMASLEQQIEATSRRCLEILAGIPVSEQVLRDNTSAFYPSITVISDHHSTYKEAASQQENLKREVSEYWSKVSKLAQAHGLGFGDEPNILIDNLLGALKEAAAAQGRAEDAKSELRNEISPDLDTAIGERKAIIIELEQLRPRLEGLGDGDLHLGLARVEEIRNDHAAMAKARSKLRSKHEYLSAIEHKIQEVRDQGGEREVLLGEVGRLNEELAITSEELSTLKGKLPTYPAVYPGIDEPIRRYLIYGGDHAESFMIGACQMMSAGEVAGKTAKTSVPERVVSRFLDWREAWTTTDSEVVQGVAENQLHRLSAPIISMSPTRREIVVLIGPQKLTGLDPDSQVSMEVSSDDSKADRQVYNFRRYAIDDDVSETKQLEFPLPTPATRYQFRLLHSDEAISTWNVVANDQFYAFRQGSGRLISDDFLPRERIWLALAKDFSVRPSNLVIADAGELHGPWKEYSLLQLDLTDANELILYNKLTERTVARPLNYGEPPKVGFMGGSHLAGGSSYGAEVYAGAPPNIRIPAVSLDELRFWRLSLVPAHIAATREVREHFRLSDLEAAIQLDSEGGQAVISLAHESLLGSHPFGAYHIRIHRSPYTDWRRTICVLPKLEYSFDRQVYFPRQVSDPPRIELDLSLSQNLEFITNPPARTERRSDKYTLISVDGRNDAVSGTLIQAGTNVEAGIPLRIQIPKIEWRFQGSVDNEFIIWNDSIEEVWIGEDAPDLFLILRLPPILEGSQVTLDMSGDSMKKAVSSVENGHARFDLLTFSDEFKHVPTLQSLKVSTAPHDALIKIQDEVVVDVITRWEAEEIECLQIVEGRSLILEVSWGERGRAKAKNLSLRSELGSRSDPVAEQTVGADARSARLVVDTRDASPGRYLLHLIPTDLWSSTTSVRPSKGDPNTLLIEIVTAGDLRRGEACLVGVVEDDRGKAYKLEFRYLITILGKIVGGKLPSGASTGRKVLVTRSNEGWYVGRVSVDVFDEDEFENQIQEANPVKLEYDVEADCITAVEDKYGEGSMLCEDCSRLYWSVDVLRDEERRNHKLLGPIEMFRVIWEEGPALSNADKPTAMHRVVDL